MTETLAQTSRFTTDPTQELTVEPTMSPSETTSQTGTVPSPFNDTSTTPRGRAADLDWVEIDRMRVNPDAQREINNEWVNRLVRDFDPDAFGTITVNLREDGFYYIVDGQHRIEAMRLMGWTDQKVMCVVYHGLTEAQEAQLFLELNRRLAVGAMSKFKVSVSAGRPENVAINRILEALNLKVGQHKTGGGITAVGTLERTYTRMGPDVLSRSLALIVAGFGDEGLSAAVIDGMAMFVARYGEQLDDNATAEKLRRVNAGAKGLLGRAETLRSIHGQPKHQCVAAALVDVVNAGRGGYKLRTWWAVG